MSKKLTTIAAKPMAGKTPVKPEVFDHDAPTRELPALVLPATEEGGEKAEMVTLWFPRSFLRDLRTIQADRKESLVQILARHARETVAAEAAVIRRRQRKAGGGS